MGMKPKHKAERERDVKFWKDTVGKNVCKKCGEPTEPNHDTCFEYPNCKQISRKHITRKIVFGK